MWNYSMKRVILAPKVPLLSFDYDSLLFKQFLRNSLSDPIQPKGTIAVEVMGDKVEFVVKEVQPENETSITAKTELVIHLDKADALTTQFAKLQVTRKKNEPNFVGFEEQVAAFCSLLQLKKEQRVEGKLENPLKKSLKINGILIHGESGIGKSLMVHHVLEQVKLGPVSMIQPSDMVDKKPQSLEKVFSELKSRKFNVL